jgi:hypothetical protein
MNFFITGSYYYSDRIGPKLVGVECFRYILIKMGSNSITDLVRPLGFQEVNAPRFLESRHLKVVRLAALRTGRFYPTGNIPGTHFC